MSLTYLASPYSHHNPDTRIARFHAVCRHAARLMEQGQLVFSPIAHTHPVAMQGALPTDWAYWEKYDRAILAACSKMIVLKLDGWEHSVGVKVEIEMAREKGMAIEYHEPLEPL